MERQLESSAKNGLEHHLQQLAIAAQSYPPMSRERQRCLNKLLCILQRSKKLYRTYAYFQSSSESYEDALQSTFIYVVQNIDRYKPEVSSFLTWFNTYLKWRILDSYRASRRQIQAIPLDEKLLDELPSQPTLTLPSTLEKVEEYIKEDPSGRFQNTHIKNHPNANFQYITLQRLHGLSWSEIANELGIGISTLNSFHQRSLAQFAPDIRKEFMDS